MDCIITVDTSLVHLSGSMNKETFLLCPKVPDWRWGVDEKQAWYPSVQLIRQKKVDDWSSCFSEAISMLKEKSAKLLSSSSQ